MELGGVRHRSGSIAVVVALLCALLAAAPAAAKLRKAKDLGPTPVENDCLIYKGNHPCYYGLWSGRFAVDKHLLNVGDTLTADIQTYGGRYPAYSWAPPFGTGLKAISCPTAAPPGPADGSPNYFSLQCSFRAVSKTNQWVVFGPSMGLASSSYVDGDYYAIVAGGAVSGRVLDGEGNAVAGARITITGADDVYADTDEAGFYEAVDLRPGTYTVTITRPKFCHDTGVAAVATKNCKRSVKVRLGTGEVNFRGLGKFAIYGRVRDEFKRGLAGVTIHATGLPGNVTKDIVTSADGSYRLGFEGGATVHLASVKGALQYAFTYVVRADGTVSTGTEADVTPNTKERQVKVDWELDHRLDYGEFTVPRTAANGLSHITWSGRVRTQHFDPVPNTEFVISPVSGGPAAVYCSPENQLLWPTLFQDGTLDTVGGFTAKTNAGGRLTFKAYGGTVSGYAAFDVARKGAPTDTGRGSVVFDAVSGTPFTDSGQLVRMLAAGGNQGLGLRPSPEQIVEWFAGSHVNTGFQAGAVDVMIVQAGSSRGVAFFPIGAGPAVGKAGALGPSNTTYVLDPGAFINLRGLTTMPSLSEWSGGQPVKISQPDIRTYNGWPIPARSLDGFGNCLDAAASSSIFTVHSPVNLLLTDAAGKQIGVAPDGTQKADVDGIVQRNGDAVTIIAPAGSYTASLVGTGKGPVTIESRTPSGDSTATFSSKKGAKASTKVAGAGLAAFTFAGAKIKPVGGRVLAVTKLPKTWRDLVSVPIAGSQVVDADGLPIARATVSVRVPGEQKPLVLATDATGTLSGFWPGLRKGRHTLTVAAAGYRTTTIVVTVRRRR